MPRYTIPPERLELYYAIKPWVIGFESFEDNERPALKQNAPKEIVEKRDKWVELVRNSTDD